ncbi:hypothetical protein OG21DRAFT_320261 [Imleria badia]|nr:hypothetical protein OG21DRAFT_320261 [Imleria badia]
MTLLRMLHPLPMDNFASLCYTYRYVTEVGMYRAASLFAKQCFGESRSTYVYIQTQISVSAINAAKGPEEGGSIAIDPLGKAGGGNVVSHLHAAPMSLDEVW